MVKFSGTSLGELDGDGALAGDVLNLFLDSSFKIGGELLHEHGEIGMVVTLERLEGAQLALELFDTHVGEAFATLASPGGLTPNTNFQNFGRRKIPGRILIKFI